jgi:hypothetical protein
MRVAQLIISVFITSSLFGQTWQTIYGSDISSIGAFTGGGAGTMASKKFKINPFDNSIWMAKGSNIQVLKNDGTLELFNNTTSPILNASGSFLEFEFTPTRTYLLDEYYGLYKYSGVSWANVYLGSWGIHLSSDIDTVWMSHSNNTSIISTYNGFVFQSSNLNSRRAQSRNGNLWISSSYNSDIAKFNNNLFNLYSPDTSFLLDWSNYDFKFAKKTDTLYVSGALGFSLAYNDAFIDTITPGNSLNMPSASIIEFEFDNQNNIWAVFGNSSYFANAIGYYDQASETWTQVYDASNSPIDFSTRISIEVDTSGNLWVANSQNLHVLKINNPPAWLSVYEKEKLETIAIYPNPVKDILTFSSNGIEIENSEIIDLNGNVLLTNFNSEKIDISSLEAGMYFIRFKTAFGRVFQEKFIKE